MAKRNPYTGLHPDLFSEGKPAFGKKAPAFRTLNLPDVEKRKHFQMRDPGEVDAALSYEAGDTLAFVPLADLTTDQIRELPRRAFTNEEWGQLDDGDRDWIEENDEDRTDSIEKLVTNLRWQYRLALENSGSNLFEDVEHDLEHRIRNEPDTLYKHMVDAAGEVYDRLFKSGRVMGLNENEIHRAINEAMQDSNNYDVERAGGTSNAFAWAEIEGRIYVDHHDVKEWNEKLFPDEVEEALKQVERATGMDLDLKGFLKGRDIDYSWGTGDFAVARANWDKVEAEALEGIETMDIPDDRDSGTAAPPEERVLHRWPDGFYVQDLLPSELEAEGKIMGMCVGRADMGYGKALRDGSIKILSLRRPNGKPLFTLEVSLDHEGEINGVDQVKGKANRLPGFDLGKETAVFITSMDDNDARRREAAVAGLKRDEVGRVFYVVKEICGIEQPHAVVDLTPAARAILLLPLGTDIWARNMVENYDIPPDIGVRRNPAKRPAAECKAHDASCGGFCAPYRRRR